MINTFTIKYKLVSKLNNYKMTTTTIKIINLDKIKMKEFKNLKIHPNIKFIIVLDKFFSFPNFSISFKKLFFSSLFNLVINFSITKFP